MSTSGNQELGDSPGPVNNSGGYVIINGSTNDSVTNSGGSVTIKNNANTATINNTGGMIVIGQDANTSTLTTNCNITIGDDITGGGVL